MGVALVVVAGVVGFAMFAARAVLAMLLINS